VKAKDRYGYESDWATLEVKMPMNMDQISKISVYVMENVGEVSSSTASSGMSLLR